MNYWFALKFVTVSFLALAVGAETSAWLSWLPEKYIGAVALGFFGGLLQVSVPYVMKSHTKPTATEITWTMIGAIVVGVLCSGVEIPYLKDNVDPKDFWRVNTFMISFIGVSGLIWSKNTVGAILRLAAKGIP